jgi:hypothetical protein
MYSDLSILRSSINKLPLADILLLLTAARDDIQSNVAMNGPPLIESLIFSCAFGSHITEVATA